MSTEVPTGEDPDGTYINYCDDDFCVVQLKLTGGKYAADAEGFRAYIGYDEDGKGFIVDSGWSDEDGETIVSVYKTLLGNNAMPEFLYLTHAHPDHQWGIDMILAEWPSLPIYVGVRGILTDITNWNALNGKTVSYNAQLLDKDLSIYGSGSVYNVVNFLGVETSYAGMLMVVYGDRKMLFAGDIFSPRSHLYMYNPYNGYDTFPQTDDTLCQWGTQILNMMCSLDDDIEVYSGHGPTSQDYESTVGYDWREAAQENIDWMIDFRNVAYNTCNSTHGWAQMAEMYPTFGMKHYSEIFGLASWIPGGASYLGCSCVASTSTDSSGIPEYTPNDCNTDLSTVPVCGVFDNSYTLDARCSALGLTTQTAAEASQSSGSSAGDDDGVLEDVVVPLVGATFGLSFFVLVFLLLSFFGVFRAKRESNAKDNATSNPVHGKVELA